MSLVWVYAVRAAAEPVAGLDVVGVDGERPRWVVAGSLGAVVGTVADERFDEAGLAVAMDDLARLEGLARAHHAVVVATAEAAGTVVPVRLATVFRSDDAVVAMLEARATEFHDALDRVRGRHEWGVKVYVDGSVPAEEPDVAASGSRPGTSYLLRRRADRDRSAAAAARAREVAESVATRAAARAVDTRRFPLQDARLSGRAQEMVLNATYLVEASREDAFRSAVTGTDGAVTVELTGPWPPFSFATTDPP